MPDVVYISGDVNVNLEDISDTNVTIQSEETVNGNVDGVTVTYGNLPRGGVQDDLLVKQSNLNFDARWTDVRGANLRHIYADTKANWNAQIDMIGERDAIYIYTDQYESDGVVTPGIKIGDGLAYLIDTPFISKPIVDMLTAHTSDGQIHVTELERLFWNDKVTCFLSESDLENLVFTKDNVL